MNKPRSAAPPSPPARAAGGRPRSKRNDLAILAAAKEILIEEGYAALSYEAITQRTGIGRATIYRRWASKMHLVDAIAHGAGAGAGTALGGSAAGATPASFASASGEGDFQTRLRGILSRMLAFYSRPEVPAAISGLMSEYKGRNNPGNELRKPVEQAARADFTRIVEAARQNGEIGADVDSDALFDIVVGAIVHRTVFSFKPASDGLVEEIASIVLQGVAPKG